MNVLVVDDEVAICRGTERRLRGILSPEDRIVCAFSGTEAEDRFRSMRTDLVITDIRMEDMDGLTLLENLLSSHSDFVSIIITAYDTFQYAQKAIRLGTVDFLVKPYTPSELRTSVERARESLLTLRQHRSMRLESQIHAGIQKGAALDRSIFEGVGGMPEQISVRLVRWDGELSDFPETALWHIFSRTYGFALAEDRPQELLSCLEPLPGLRFGISSVGERLDLLWAQAGKALDIASCAGMPHIVLFREGMEDQGLFRGGIAVPYALDYIEKHRGHPIRMEALCEEMHMNYSYFSRQFKQSTGEPFSQFLLREQMQWACDRMCEGWRVGEAADQLGYQSVESFSKAFSRIYGESPRNYVQKQVQKMERKERP